MSGKPGRPREDRLLRQREIFQAVAPILESEGARRLTMRQAAKAASVSLGGLYHYFPTKRDLVLHAMSAEAFDRMCFDFYAQYGHLEETDPARFLGLYVEFQVAQMSFVRPALHAALELGAELFMTELERGMQDSMDSFVAILRRVVTAPSEKDLEPLARWIRRTLFASVLDRTMTPDDLRAELHALVSVQPIGQSKIPALSTG